MKIPELITGTEKILKRKIRVAPIIVGALGAEARLRDAISDELEYRAMAETMLSTTFLVFKDAERHSRVHESSSRSISCNNRQS